MVNGDGAAQSLIRCSENYILRKPRKRVNGMRGRAPQWMLWLLSGVLATSSSSVLAQPDLETGRQAGSLTVYGDDRRPGLYYYAPNGLILAELLPGQPDLHFLQMRYTGTMATGDQGNMGYRSLLQFRVVMPAIGAQELHAAERMLATKTGSVELRPLPIRRVEAVLVYAPLTRDAQQSTPQQLPAGHFQEAEDEKEARSDVYWTERIYTLTLDNDTSQLFWSALQQGQVVLSVGYAFMADGVANEAPQVKLTGPAELTDALRARIDAGSTDPRQRPAFAIRAGAFAVTVDAIKWPDLFKRVDINERMPPCYAALDVYCYDFQKQEAGIYEKRVDIEADGVGGRPVSIQARFQRKQPDIYARSLRFPFAVRLDRPYRYRVVTILSDGRIQETPWQVRTSWTQLLDVTATMEGHVDDDPDRQRGASH